MIRVTAATSFLGNEGMWRAGESKVVSNHRAHELIEQGWVIEARDQSNLEAAADPPAAAEPEPVTSESLRKPKKKKPGEARETKPEEPEAETK